MVVVLWCLINSIKSKKSFSNVWFDTVALNFTDDEFQYHFRIPSSAFEILHSKLLPHYRSKKTSCRKGLVATLWLLATGNCYRSIAQLFGIPKSTFARIVRYICKLICQQFNNQVTYNKERSYFDVKVAKFGHRYGQANVCCAIDGTFIKIKRPKGICSERYYSGYKQTYGLNMLTVVDYDGLFLFTHIGFPASVHDSAVFLVSQLYRDIIQSRTIIGPDYKIIGDSAFGATDYMIRSTEQIGSGCARAIVENAFGQLKQKFRYLMKSIETDITDVPYFIRSCVILHNLNKQFFINNQICLLIPDTF